MVQLSRLHEILTLIRISEFKVGAVLESLLRLSKFIRNPPSGIAGAEKCTAYRSGGTGG